ncbi:MAG: hypothetical protein E7603_07575 [Ruminococcaceae bacterium]|nr:hypothetical protein [Oscillospiraceae bacterium]
MSDSQFLTDPRIAMMMDGFSEKKMGEHEAWDDISEWHRGFESLLKNGLVEVAHRTDVLGEEYSMVDVWKSMHNNRSASVPFLPPKPTYASFLDGIYHQKRYYNLSNIAERFKNNLHKGISTGDFLLRATDDTDRELMKLLNEDTVLFRNIFQLIKSQYQKERISAERFHEIYQYVYSCYHTNVPAEVNCFVYTNYESLPLHLNLGCEVQDINTETDEKKIRPTWALDPKILDMMTIDSFLEVRKRIEPYLKEELLMKQKTGELLPEECPAFYDLWESYTAELENALKEQIFSLYENIDELMSKQFISSQKRLKNNMLDIIGNITKTGISAVCPPAQLLFDIAEYGKMGIEGINNLIMIHNRREMEYLSKQKRELLDRIKKIYLGAKVITCYR